MDESFGLSETWRDVLHAKEKVPLHFIGAGGVSVSSLAQYALRQGHSVTGSDRTQSDALRALRRAGAKIAVGHSRENLPAGVGLVVASCAIAPDNPEILAARERGIPVVSRASLLGEWMKDYKMRVGVGGTHGKSTVTAMLERVFRLHRCRPTVFSGAALSCGEPYVFGGRDWFLYESCEYRDSFLRFYPTTQVFLNLEWDHTDWFADETALCRSFTAAGALARDNVILSADDKNLCRVAAALPPEKVLTFGRAAHADFRYTVRAYTHGYVTMDCYYRETPLGVLSLSVPGEFQAANAAAAAMCALSCGIPWEIIRAALEGYTGIGRRLERIGTFAGRPVFYDYAHHPTEIRAGLRTLGDMTGAAVTVVFCPHTYSRTADLWDGFVAALSEAQTVYLLPIFAARETPRTGITSAALAAAIREKTGKEAISLTAAEVPTALRDGTGAVVLMGAGDFSEVRAALS